LGQVARPRLPGTLRRSKAIDQTGDLALQRIATFAQVLERRLVGGRAFCTGTAHPDLRQVLTNLFKVRVELGCLSVLTYFQGLFPVAPGPPPPPLPRPPPP